MEYTGAQLDAEMHYAGVDAALLHTDPMMVRSSEPLRDICDEFPGRMWALSLPFCCCPWLNLLTAVCWPALPWRRWTSGEYRQRAPPSSLRCGRPCESIGFTP